MTAAYWSPFIRRTLSLSLRTRDKQSAKHGPRLEKGTELFGYNVVARGAALAFTFGDSNSYAKERW